MVFEALVVELLNKFLKQYVENLDTSQLKIGIWGGDVVLNNLQIKTTVFDDLNLPVRVKWGKLQKLALKIPWKNLYGSQVVVDIEELLMVLIPCTEFTYDPVKEEKWENDKKQAKLRAVEEARNREQETIKQSDGFVEKLLTQIIKNIQVVIRNIHIRYEDQTTNPNCPFSLGITMSNLSATTSSLDRASVESESASSENFICKIVHLEGLAIYWNSDSELYSEYDSKALNKALVNNITKDNYRPKDYVYIFGPLSASAYLKLNPKPENDGSNFSIPKFYVNVNLRKIDLAANHEQLCDVILFVQNYRRLSAAAKYRKYRPVGISVMSNPKKWWHFAYNCVAQDIRRRKLEWSWDNISTHRQMCRKYSQIYEMKLNSKKVMPEILEELKNLEKKLNVFNILLLREQAYVQVERSNLAKETKSSSSGWFSSWFGYGATAKPIQSEHDLVTKIVSVMTPQEKEKLHKAIGYDENSPPPNYPPEFVEIKFEFELEEIRITLSDHKLGALLPVMTGSIKMVKMEFEQRPAAFAMKFNMTVGKMQVLGRKNEADQTYPEMITSNCTESESLVEFLYETKPLDGLCDQRIHAQARPLSIIYHADSINGVIDIFDVGGAETISSFVSASSLPAFQKITAIGLQYAIEKRAIVDVKVNIMPSHVIIPYGGSYDKNKDMLVLMLGRLNIETDESEQKDVSVKKLYLEGTPEQEIFSTVLSASYTNFKCELTGVQVLLQLVGEDWIEAADVKGKSPLRFLESTDLVVVVKKSLVTDDSRIPKIICEGNLPSLEFNFSEERLVAFAALICSIPSNVKESEGLLKKTTSLSLWSLQSLGAQLENKLTNRNKEYSVCQPVEYVQGIDFVLHFEMNELSLSILKKREKQSPAKSENTNIQTNPEEKFLSLRFVKLEVELTRKTFEMVSLLKLRGVEFLQHFKTKTLPVFTTRGVQQDYYLFIIEFIKVDTMAPDFRTERGGIVNHITLNVTSLNIVLDRDSLLSQIAFFGHIKDRLEDVRKSSQLYRTGNAGKAKDLDHLTDMILDKKIMPKGKKFRKKLPKKEIIDLFFDANLEEISIIVQYEGKGLSEFAVKGASIEISTRKSYTNFDFKLREIFLSDLFEGSRHKKIIESLDKHTINSQITIFNSDYYGSEDAVDMLVEAEIGGLRCVYLNFYLARVIAFMNAFQSQVQTLKEGATVAAQRAKENVIKAYQKTSRFCLNIKITAPFIVVPRNCNSLEVLVIDLGVLTIKNNITELNYPHEGESATRPCIDTVRCHLQNLKFSRCVLENNYTAVEYEKLCLKPMSFELCIMRNLSAAWLKAIPEFEVVARLALVHVTLSHGDLCNIVTIITDNTSEHPNIISKSYQYKEQGDTKAATKQKESLRRSNSTFNVDEAAVDENNFYTVIKFTFSMDSFVLDVLAEEDSTERSITAETECLARFVLETISIKGRKFSNNSMDVSMLLVSCLLDDTRPGKPGRLTRLMERTNANLSERDIFDPSYIKSMVELNYEKKGLDVFVEMKVYKFTLILSMDFLHKLKGFFTIEELQHSVDMETFDTSKAMKTFEPKKKILMDDMASEIHPTFTVNLRLEKPDIIIVENMDSIDTDALIFHTEIVMKYRVIGIRQVITGTLGNIELYSCCFNPTKRRHTLNQVIKPFTISVAGSTPIDQGLHVDICLTEILISINPSTVELISKCYAALLAEVSSNEKDTEENNFSDLWESKRFNPNDYWFLKTEQGEDALSIFSRTSSEGFEKSILEEICLLAIPSVVILVDGLTAKHSRPLLMLQMGFQLQAYNWSTKLTISSTLTLLLQYYNKIMSAWEPLIEPVEIQEDKEKKIKHSHTPWEVYFSVVFGEEGYLDTIEPPKVSLSLSSTEVLPITLTKTGVDVLKNVVETFTSAVTKGVVNKIGDLPPFVVKNDTGLLVELLLNESNLQVCRAVSDQYKIVKLESNSEVELQMKSTRISQAKTPSPVEGKKGLKLCVRFPISKGTIFELPLNLASTRYYPMPVQEFHIGELWSLVVDISIRDNTTTVVLRSILKIINYFNEPINIHALSESGNEAEYVGVVEGNSNYTLPFHAVYNSNKKLFFSVNGYYLSTHPFPWNNIKKDSDVSMLLQCNTRTPENNDPFFIQAVGEVEEIYYTNTNRRLRTSICYIIHLQPTVKIVNSLPVDLIICFQGSAKEKYLQPGNTLQITCAEPGNSSVTLRINNYLEKEWSSKESIVENPAEFFIWKFISYNGLSPETLNLGVHCTFVRKTAIYTIYCPYFMVNKTDHLLSYRFDGSHTVFYHPKDFNSPVMFSPTFRKFFSKKSAYLKINYSDWSDKFPVDVAGSGGTVECSESSSNITYKLSVSITLTYNSLTKIVTFTPYYVFINETPFTIEYMERNSTDATWQQIPSDSCTPFWPQHQSKSKDIQIRPKGSKSVTPPFGYSSTDTCLLKLNDKNGGIFASIQATQSGTYITFSPYESGQAPALIINYSGKTIKLFEVGTDFKITLKADHKVMHAWVAPTGTRKLGVMNPKRMKDEIYLDQDGNGQVFTSKGEAVRYLTFLDGTQRVLLFTDDVSLSSSISNSLKIPSSGFELICEIHGIGISIVNNLTRVEILYMGFVSSDIIWEIKKVGRSRYKRVKQDFMYKIEEAYAKYQSENESNSDVDPEVNITDKMKVNFDTMTMLEPYVRELKRTFEPGVWLAYRLMDDQIMINLKVNKIQIDNQLQEHIFPVILSPVPPPKSVSALFHGCKPFFELSIVKKAADPSGVEQYKYFEILVQEFHVKIDIGFIQQFWQFLSPEQIGDEEEKINFLKDLKRIQQPLMSHVEVMSSHEQKDFYELLHFSPLKIHFSFSLAGMIENGSLPPALSVLIQSVGVTLADIHDVIFRLSYFERKCVFLSKSQLQSEVISHYSGQTVRQAYVLVLGLDVIGNPFGLIVGIGEGVEAFFYEPFQGIIHGPSEFATGVAIGCKSLFGRTVSSTAGTLEKLTGTLGKGLAVLSLDKEYQQQRMEGQNRQENIQASMARGGRGLVMGVFEGVTGVVKKPLEGAKEEGVGGFFKGMGKGMMGLVTRPVSGVVDFASTSFKAVRRATGLNFENKRQRPPRFFRDGQIVQPYNLYEASGNAVFHAICRRKYCSTDKYEHHLALKEKEVAVFTNKRMILAELQELFGTWQEHMAIMWKSMPESPKCHTKGVAITLPPRPGAAKREKPEVKILLIGDKETREELCRRMIELYNFEKQEQE